MTSESSFVAAMLIVIPIIVVALLMWALRRHRTIVRLRREGKYVEGKVIETAKEDLGNRTIFKVHYEFYIESDDANDGRWVASQMISRLHFNRLMAGDAVGIYYLPSNPVVSRVAGPDLDYSSHDAALGIAIILAAIWSAVLLAYLTH